MLDATLTVMVKVLWEAKYGITIKAVCVYIYTVYIQIYGIYVYTYDVFFTICKKFLNNLFLSLVAHWYGRKVKYYHLQITNEDTGAQKPAPLSADLVLLCFLSTVSDNI